jgi:carbamoylphosphate synthase large subunit
MNVIFVEPFFPSNQREFVRGLAESGATVIGIGEYPEDAMDDQLKSWMTHYHQVPTVIDVAIMTDAVRWVQDKVWVDRLETSIEAHTMATAQVRENCGIPGTSVRTAWLCRDKPSMKQALREVGVPTAASTAADSAQQVYDFADAVGYPLILKPRSGAGAQDTTRVDNRVELDAALGAFGADTASIAVEEFVEGHEGFYDTLSVNGRPELDFVCHYYPNVLDAMRTRWISPQFVSTNRVDSVDEYQQLREMGYRVN